MKFARFAGIAILLVMSLAFNGCGGGGGTTATGVNVQPQISSFTASKTTLLINELSSLSVTASDANGDPLSYNWSATGGTLTMVSASVYSFSTTQAGQFTVSITVNDGKGGTDTDSKVITCFGATESEGGAQGAISVPAEAARAGATTSDNTLDAPIEIQPASARDTGRYVAFGNKGESSYCAAINFSPGELIAEFDNIQPADFAAENGLTVKQDGNGGPSLLAIDIDGLDEQAALDITREKCLALNNSDSVKYVELNGKVKSLSTTPNDTMYSSQWHYELINLPQAWDITTGSADVIVAVIDTGIVSAHTDIASKIVSGYDFISDTSSSCDGDGIDSNPEDVADSRCMAGAIPVYSPQHSGYHGTHVAGTIGAASNNSTGVAGVAWETKIMPIRALGAGGGTDTDIIQGIRYAVGLSNSSGVILAEQNRAKVINMSLGGDPGTGCPASYQSLFNELHSLGVSIFVAAGNEYSENGLNPLAICNYAVSVAAVDRDSNHAPYSNKGTGLDISAPGGSQTVRESDGVLSTVRNDNSGTTSSYTYYEGTSMATPHAAGVAALMIAAYSSITPDQIATLLAQTATDLGDTGTDTTFGAGLINAYSAVREAKSLGGTVNDPTGPVIAVSSSALDFAYSETSKTVLITNTGISTLSITSITDTESSGGNWMSTSYAANGSGFDLTVSVDRSGMSSRTYTGYVSIQSNGGNKTINVTMQVGEPSVEPDPSCIDSTIYILALDPDNWDTLGQDSVVYSGGSFNIFELDQGSVYIVAGTDCNGDNYICEQSIDVCGMYPSYADPAEIAITGKQFSGNVNFSASRQTSRLSGASPEIPLDAGFRKMR
ncbi:MAG TPA: S8 family serine peptidase [bacterium]|nr:S8 family serine peptidase [bacterium]